MIVARETELGTSGFPLGFVIPGPWSISFGGVAFKVGAGEVAVLVKIEKTYATWLIGSIMEVYRDIVNARAQGKPWADNAVRSWNAIAQRRAEFEEEKGRSEREKTVSAEHERQRAIAEQEKKAQKEFQERLEQLRKKFPGSASFARGPSKSPFDVRPSRARLPEPKSPGIMTRQRKRDVETVVSRSQLFGKPRQMWGDIPKGMERGDVVLGPIWVSYQVRRPLRGDEGDFIVRRSDQGTSFFIARGMIAVLTRIDKKREKEPGLWIIGSTRAVWDYVSADIAALIRRNDHAPGIYSSSMHREILGLDP